MPNRAATPAGRRRAAARVDGSGRGATKPRRKPRPPATKGPAKPQAVKRPARPRPKKRAGAKRAIRRSAPKRASGRRFGLPSLRLPRISWPRCVAIVLVLLAALAAGYFLWFRDSSLVAITKVEVKGVSSAQRQEIDAALARAAKGMTTLHVRQDGLEAAVASFPTVESIRAEASFPHTLRIDVAERPPTLVASAAGKEVSVAADGTVLAGIDPPEGLPRLEVDEIPPSGRLDGQALDQALVVGAAPEELAQLIEGIGYSDDQGVELRMRGGVELRFGSGVRAATKWAAAAAVLADPKLESASYVDVQVPERPAVGG